MALWPPRTWFVSASSTSRSLASKGSNRTEPNQVRGSWSPLGTICFNILPHVVQSITIDQSGSMLTLTFGNVFSLKIEIRRFLFLDRNFVFRMSHFRPIHPHERCWLNHSMDGFGCRAAATDGWLSVFLEISVCSRVLLRSDLPYAVEGHGDSIVFSAGTRFLSCPCLVRGPGLVLYLLDAGFRSCPSTSAALRMGGFSPALCFNDG